jgi:hypothetical protein
MTLVPVTKGEKERKKRGPCQNTYKIFMLNNDLLNVADIEKTRDDFLRTIFFEIRDPGLQQLEGQLE